MLEYAILAGVLFGAYFSLIGLGLNLVFGVMRIVNLAHGDFVMLGAMAASIFYATYLVSPILIAVGCLVAFILIGIPLYYLLIPRLLNTSDPEMFSIILFFGVAQVIEALTTITIGPSERSIPNDAFGNEPISILGQSFSAVWVISAAVSAAAVLLVFAYLYRTRLGLLTRAVMAHRDEALATGINAGRVSAVVFGIGIALAAVAGVFAPFMEGAITPTSGGDLTILAFVVIVIGSLGSPAGTILGGMIYGITLMIMQMYWSSWASLFPYLILILVLVIRPYGLLGRAVRRA